MGIASVLLVCLCSADRYAELFSEILCMLRILFAMRTWLSVKMWTFEQACTEMIMPMSSNSSNSMFQPYDWDLEGNIQYCMKTYGVRPRPNWITTNYGGKVM